MSKSNREGNTYMIIAVTLGLLAAPFVFLYSLATYGLILGTVLGIIAAPVLGAIIGLLWPLWAIIIAGGVAVFLATAARTVL